MRLARSLCVALALAAAAGCATSAAFRAGEKAERQRPVRPRGARVLEGGQGEPGQPHVPARCWSARGCASSEDHVASARRLAARGLLKEALDELRLALDLQPSVDAARRTSSGSRPCAAPASRPRRLRCQARGARARVPRPRPRPRGARAAGPDVPRREPARGLPGAGPCGRRQLRLRSRVPGPDRQPRPARTSPSSRRCWRSASVGQTFHRVGRRAHDASSSPTPPTSAASTSSRW